MARQDHDREILRYQREVAAAARELTRAMRAWTASQPPMSDDATAPPPDWTDEHRALTRVATNAWRDFAFKRGAYDGLIQERDYLYPDPKTSPGTGVSA